VTAMDPMHSESTPRKARWRVWLWVVAALILVVLLPVVLLVLLSVRANARVEAELARIRAAGEPATPAELEAFYRYPPADEDVTQLWLAATATLNTKEYRDSVESLPIVGNGDGEIPPPGEPWPQLKEAEDLLVQYAPSLVKLHEAADRGGAARYPTNFAAGLEMSLPHKEKLRSGARLLALEARVRAHREDAAGAARSIHAIFRLACSIEQEPTVVSQLMRMACNSLARDQIRQLLPEVAFAEHDLSQFQEDVRSVHYWPGLRRALLGERVWMGQAFAGVTESEPGILVQLTLQADRAFYLEMMRRSIAASQQPWKLARQEWQQIQDDLLAVQRRSSLTRGQHAITMTIMSDVGRLFDAATRGDAENAIAATAIAVEFHRQRHGRLPERLDQLVPDLLPRVPQDPFDGQPLRYLVREDEYLLYSVGVDGKDDGGEDDGTDTCRPDVVFRVSVTSVAEDDENEQEQE
jgi:hypothetical protein